MLVGLGAGDPTPAKGAGWGRRGTWPGPHLGGWGLGSWVPGPSPPAPNAAIPFLSPVLGRPEERGGALGPRSPSGPADLRPAAHCSAAHRPFRPHETRGAPSGSPDPTARPAPCTPGVWGHPGPLGPPRSRTPPPRPPAHLRTPRRPRETRLAPPLRLPLAAAAAPQPDALSPGQQGPPLPGCRGSAQGTGTHFSAPSRQEKGPSAFQTGNGRGPERKRWDPGITRLGVRRGAKRRPACCFQERVLYAH